MLNDDAVQKLLARSRREVDQGFLPSCQLAIGYENQVVVNETFGDATDSTRYVLFSSTKALVAAAAWQVIDRGLLDVSKPVCQYIEEFATNGKDVVTVEQVMLHTSGFPSAPMGPHVWGSRETRLEQFSKWRLNWEPGTKCEYHPTSAHWVLAELIERLGGQDFRTAVNEGVLAALGLKTLRLGVAAAEQGDIATLQIVGAPPTEEELLATIGVRSLPASEVTDEALMGFNTTEFREVGVPGGGGVGTAAELALFYQGLLHNTAGLWSAELLHDVTSRVRNTMKDELLGVSANRSLGLVLAGDDGKSALRGMGNTVSPGTFGHNGAGGQVAWADPASGLSFAYLTNGMDANMLNSGRRTTAVASLAGLCATR